MSSMQALAYPAARFDDLPTEFKLARPELAGRSAEFKSLECEIKADRKKRRVELWIAGYGSVDRGGDLVLHGASKRTIAEDFPRGLIKLFWNHRTPLGPCELIEEHSQGTFMVGNVTDHPDLDRFLAQIDDKTAGHGSLGYAAREWEKVSAAEVQRIYGVDPAGHSQIRVIKSWRIFEGSAVIWPMNETVKVVGVNSPKKGAEPVDAQERKDLFNFADAIRCLARIRMLTRAEWAEVDEEEAEAAANLLEEMRDTAKSIESGLERVESKNAPDDAESKGLAKLVQLAEERAAALRP